MKYSLETEFKIIEEKGYLISDGRLRVVTYKDEKDFNHCKEILRSAEYKEEDWGDYVIWKDDRRKGVKEWLQFGEEQGYLKIADLKKRKFADFKKGKLTNSKRRSQEAEFEILREKGYLISDGKLRVVTYKDERDFNHCEKILENVGYKREDRGDYIIWKDNRIKGVEEWLQFGEEQGYLSIADLRKRKLIDFKRRSQEREFEIIREKGYLIAGERLRIVTYKDERDFNHCKEILEDVGYKKEDQGDYIIWSDNRIKEVKKWLQVGEELGYFKIADLEKRKLIDLKKGLKKLNLK